MSAKFYTLMTDIGAAKLASAAALGIPLKITQMAVGDGGGELPTPDAKQTALVAEKRRAALNMLYIDPQNSSQMIAEQVIPETDGGWWIREVGLFDDTGALIAVGNCPESYKPQLVEGSGRTQTVRMVLITSSTDNITLKIDPSVVLATRSYVDNLIETRQQKSDTLTALAALKPAKGKLPYFTAEKAAALADLSDFIRPMLGKADAVAVLEYLGLGYGSMVPVGAPIPWPLATPPTGFLKLNGATFDKVANPKLALAYPSGVLPDLRAQTIRGWDDGRGIDTGRALLSEQGDAIRNIVGSAANVYTGNPDLASGVLSFGGTGITTWQSGSGLSISYRNLNINVAAQVPTAAENRVKSVAFNYIVRAQ